MNEEPVIHKSQLRINPVSFLRTGYVKVHFVSELQKTNRQIFYLQNNTESFFRSGIKLQKKKRIYILCKFPDQS